MPGWNLHVNGVEGRWVTRELDRAFDDNYPEPNEELREAFKEATDHAHDLCKWVYGMDNVFDVILSGNVRDADDVNDNSPEFVSIIVTRVDAASSATAANAQVEVTIKQ